MRQVVLLRNVSCYFSSTDLNTTFNDVVNIAEALLMDFSVLMFSLILFRNCGQCFKVKIELTESQEDGSTPWQRGDTSGRRATSSLIIEKQYPSLFAFKNSELFPVSL